MNWTWLLVASGIAGVILNNYKRKECFYVWMVGNACWAVIDWYHGLYSQSVLMVVYFGLAIHGVWNWRKN